MLALGMFVCGFGVGVVVMSAIARRDLKVWQNISDRQSAVIEKLLTEGRTNRFCDSSRKKPTT